MKISSNTFLMLGMVVFFLSKICTSSGVSQIWQSSLSYSGVHWQDLQVYNSSRPPTYDLAERVCFLLGSSKLHRVSTKQPYRCIYNIFYLSLNPSGLEENCIKSRNQIRILGIAKGFDQLPPHVQAMTTNTEGENTNTLSRKEKEILKRMRCEVGESKYFIRY